MEIFFNNGSGISVESLVDMNSSLFFSFSFDFSEYCAPVVITLASEEAERICLHNGLLLHELLRYSYTLIFAVFILTSIVTSCFGHLDGLNSTIRIGNQGISVSDAHIRFERVTEVRPKTAENVDEVCRAIIFSRHFSNFPLSFTVIT